MTLHRNVALATIAALVIAAIWRWRSPASKFAAIYSAVAFPGLLGLGFLGGELVFHHAVGIPSARLAEIMRERAADGGHEHGSMNPMVSKRDTNVVQQ